MGRKTVLLDDFDGSELADDTQPVRLSLGRTTYSVFLSEENHGKLMEALTPFIENAETVSTSSPRGSTSTTTSAEKERNKKVRHWAIGSKFKYENAQGKMVTLGERGRIPDVVVKAWEAAGSPDIPSN